MLGCGTLQIDNRTPRQNHFFPTSHTLHLDTSICVANMDCVSPPHFCAAGFAGPAARSSDRPKVHPPTLQQSPRFGRALALWLRANSPAFAAAGRSRRRWCLLYDLSMPELKDRIASYSQRTHVAFAEGQIVPLLHKLRLQHLRRSQACEIVID